MLRFSLLVLAVLFERNQQQPDTGRKSRVLDRFGERTGIPRHAEPDRHVEHLLAKFHHALQRAAAAGHQGAEV